MIQFVSQQTLFKMLIERVKLDRQRSLGPKTWIENLESLVKCLKFQGTMGSVSDKIVMSPLKTPIIDDLLFSICRKFAQEVTDFEKSGFYSDERPNAVETRGIRPSNFSFVRFITQNASCLTSNKDKRFNKIEKSDKKSKEVKKNFIRTDNNRSIKNFKNLMTTEDFCSKQKKMVVKEEKNEVKSILEDKIEVRYR